MRPLSLLPVLAGAFLAVGCASPEIQPLAGDVYALTASASRYSTGKREDLKRQADAFAESKGKVAVAVPMPGSLTGIDRGGVVEYRFRLVDRDASAAPTEAPQPRTEVLAPIAEKPAPAGPVGPPIQEVKPLRQPEKVSDLYADLIKLDELRKKGILTEEEFQAQKKKLLEGTQK